MFRIDFAEADRKYAQAGKKVVSCIRSQTHPIEHFWLCEECAAAMTIELSNDGEVCLVPYAVSSKPTVASAPLAEMPRGANAS